MEKKCKKIAKMMIDRLIHAGIRVRKYVKRQDIDQIEQ
jgi:hypothetical protein